jgi:excisionase family DNA binding protein
MALSEAGFLTVAEVADLLHLNRMAVYRMVHAGDLPAIRFGHVLRVPQAAVESAVSAHTADAVSIS